MPRKTKETNEEIIESKSKTAKKTSKVKKDTAVPKSKTTAKKTTAKRETKAKAEKATKTTKKAVKDETKKTTKKVAKVEEKPAKKSTTKKKTATDKKDRTKKVSATAKKSTAKKTTKAKTVAKKTSTKSTSKSASKAKTTKTATKAKTTTTRARKTKVVAPSIVEYYDLPYKYNQTVVKVLYQNPTTLFVYWEISDNDIENYKATYGENFFETTRPVLVIYNDTMNYKFEVDINDFANCWYFNINDSKCDYRIELIRRPVSYNEKITTEYIYITSSNKIESPNDRILFSTNEPYTVYFKNVKNNNLRKVNLPRLLEKLNLLNKNFGFPIVRNVHDLYKNIYQIEDAGEFSVSLTNPSSRGGNPSSHSLSSRFI